MDVILTLVLVAAMALAGGLLVFGGPDRVAVAGTLLGSLLTAVLLERVRRRHEDTHRFEQERRAVYVRLLEAEAKAERVIRDRYIDAAILRDRPDLGTEITVPGRTDLDALRRAVDEIHLLAPMWVYMSAYMVQMTLEMMDDAALADDEKWHEGTSKEASARGEFLKRAKADLGAPTGVMTRWQERRWRLKKRLGLTRPTKRPASKKATEKP